MAERVILFIHGFMGSPRQFDRLIPLIEHEDADIERIVLDGHGSTLTAFCRSNRHSWQQSLCSKVDALRKKYSSIVLVGHSMGGLLAVHTAIKCNEGIDGIVALSFPLYVKQTLSGINNRRKSFSKPKANESELVRTGRQLSGVSGITLLNLVRLVPNTLGLLQLVRKTRRHLSSLSVPLTAICSRNDELVSMKTIPFVQKKLPAARCITLEKANHFLFSDEEYRIVAAAINGIN